MTQTVISHYRVLHQLGEGGMGIVYRAEDLRLSREVAIKFLRTEDGAHAPWLARFEREARLASALKHPHICTIHELGEQDGVPFIVMELLEGRTMRQRIEEGPLPVEGVVTFGVQIGTALEAAHARGIVHRDIKPANLFVTHGEHLKVLDFGLAKLADRPAALSTITATHAAAQTRTDADVTVTGAAVGTAAYMSPEQATGARVDARTDLFSFGSVLYEMATGRRAFPGENAGTVIQRLLRGEFIPPRSLRPAIPERLEMIILRAMEVDPNRRYQTASGMLEDLRSLARALTPEASMTRAALAAAETAPSSRTRRSVWPRAGAAACVLLLGGAGAWQRMRASHVPALGSRDSILVGGFMNTTGDTEFDETLGVALKVQLGQSPFLDIVPDDRIAEELKLMQHREDERLTHDRARALCERIGVKAMLDGTIAALGTNYFLTLNATDCRTGETFGRQQGEVTSKEEVIRKLGTMASDMRTTLGESLPSIKKFDVPIEQATTPSLAALKAYALGVAERRRGGELESVAFFNRAIEIDPEFAAAYTTLSTVYGSLGEWRRSEEYARLAYARQKRVSERERLFITYQYHDRVTGNQDEAATTLELWKLAYPRDYRPVNALALIYNRFGRYDRAVVEATEALRRTPGSAFSMSNLAFAYRGLGQWAEARTIAEQAVSLGVATTPTRRLLYQLGILQGDGSADKQLEWAKSQPREFDLISARAQVAAFGGRLREASQLYAQAADMATARSLSGTASGYWAHLALTEAVYGDPQRGSERVRALVARTATAAESPGTVPRFRAAVALGLVGLDADAREIVASARQRYPDSTVIRTVLVPTSEAAISIRRRQPAEAIAALQAAVPTEFGTVAGLVPTFMRGEAYLALRDARAARVEYEKVLAHRGADPFAPVIPLARLGLARAWRLSGDLDKSRHEYDELLRIWKDADRDLPLLERARAERASLEAAPPPSAPTPP